MPKASSYAEVSSTNATLLGLDENSRVKRFDPGEVVSLERIAESSYGGPGYIAKVAADTAAGVVDWANDAALGYLYHLRLGPNSTGSSAALGLGTDRGAGHGILLSHKNAGAGIFITQQPGSGFGMDLRGWGANANIYSEVQGGSGGLLRTVVKNGAGFADGVTTLGSPTFTSATATFSIADEGATLAQKASRDSADPTGCIPSGTTILTYVSPTQVTMSQNAQATGSGIIFSITGTGYRLAPANQVIMDALDTDGSTVLMRFRRNAWAMLVPANFKTNDVGSVGLEAQAIASQTADVFRSLTSGGTAGFRVTSTQRAVAGFAAYVSNAGDATRDALTVQNFTTTKVGALIIGVASQSANLLEIQDSANNPIWWVNKGGYAVIGNNSAPADGDILAGKAYLWFDPANGASKLMVKGKSTNGTVVAGEVVLS